MLWLAESSNRERNGFRKLRAKAGFMHHSDFLLDGTVDRCWDDESTLERAGKRQTVYDIIHTLNTLKVESLISEAEQREITRDELKGILAELRAKGLVYSPKPGEIVCVED
ncbi:MAG: hypothetical protein GF416_01960 [Candidatus Altiarchaeales archaeon]|nr:hypothetical protein [Candidatus Altiarchaeales archaeon]MBD3415882.1 hypothetical protein [Candidatus Altiarchaeales archaeon]